jgi:hypothetical protein
MAQINQRSKDAATYIGRETTFAAEPITMVRAFPVEGSFVAELEQTELENLEESVDLYDNKATVRGLKGGSVKMDFYARVPAAILADTVAPVPHYLGTLLDTALGASASDEGAVMDAATAPATFDVLAGQGVRFEQGQWVGVEVAGTIEPARVSTIAVDNLLVYPLFSASPTAGGVVHNSYTYAPEPDHTSTLHIQHAKSATFGTGLQWSISGSTANISFDIKRNDLAKISLEGQAGSWHGPGNFGFVTSSASDSMSAPFAVRDAITLFQPNATTSRTSYCLISADVKINGGMEHVECLGNIEGKSGAFRKGQRIFAEATLKFRFDQDIDATNWTNQTLMSCIVMIPKGAGLTKRWFILDMPSCRIVGKPKLSDENGMLYMEATVVATMDKVTTQSGIPTSIESAPFRIALI